MYKNLKFTFQYVSRDKLVTVYSSILQIIMFILLKKNEKNNENKTLLQSRTFVIIRGLLKRFVQLYK